MLSSHNFSVKSGLKAAILGFCLCLVAGCGVINAVVDWFQKNCEPAGAGMSCTLGLTHSQQQRAANFSAAELAAFSSESLEIDISQGSAVLSSFGGNAEVTLLSGTNPIASIQVAMHLDNGVIVVENPAAFDAWLQTHGINANGFDVQLDDIQFNLVPGSNTVHTLVNYGSEVITTRSFAHWVSPFDPICCEVVR